MGLPRENRHLLEVTRSIMFSTNVPKFFWGEVVLINRMFSRVLRFQTPCQVLLKSYPDTQLLSTIPSKVLSKLNLPGIKCVFLRYSLNLKGYKCYSPVTRKLYNNSMEVTFFENQSYSKSDIQREHTTKEYQFWKTEITTSSLQTLDSHIPQSHIPRSQSPPMIESLDTMVEPPRTRPHSIHSQPANNNDFIVYYRKKTQKETEQRTYPEQVHEAEPNSNHSEISPSNTNSDPVTNELQNDSLNLPIAKRKGV